ncbi:sodium-dependent transporter [Janibacter alkaliphilus]|uniref:NSS family neurotransmitter:Na+ symporter n=1 Tax=Janibacter alkaliphilus TaxID=1069963 RepID=A0A852X4R1_9MICO|nr:sodium-dependent transporter [Janibacter alkaliphilus]NYG37408.1 NSS family neurotransmitter:Na+ symporter [Janibacter alkaliphilus]
MSTQSTGQGHEASEKHGFSTRRAFILAAIGSAVGLGNIWRFPYVAYEGGGGAFIVPYLVALLLAGIPMLFLDYAIGHRLRGSPPLSFRRVSRKAEWLGWWQVLICAVIAVYYAAIIAWAVRYTGFSIDQSWGADPEAFLFGDFLQAAETPGPTLEVVPGVMIPMVIVWLVTLAVLALGVQGGIGRVATVFIPLLVVAFAVLVVRALFLPGSELGLDALFSPDWAALGDPSVWVAAFGQIFFSLSVGFGIMITYASYVDRKTDMTGSGAVVAFSNSGFEVLAGIGIFAALGFMAQAAGVAVSEVVANGIGLAFVGFPTIISEAPAGALIGLLFFGSLVVAGLTSLISITEVVISAVRDKLGLTRPVAVAVVGLPMMLISCLFFGTTGGVYVLDTMDTWINSFGILVVAAVAMLLLTYVWRALPALADHMNRISSIHLGRWWFVLVGAVVPFVLLVILGQDLWNRLETPYEDYPASLLNTFGWGVVIVVPILAVLLSLLPWRSGLSLEDPGEEPSSRGPDERDVPDAHASTNGTAETHGTVDQEETR